MRLVEMAAEQRLQAVEARVLNDWSVLAGVPVAPECYLPNVGTVAEHVVQLGARETVCLRPEADRLGVQQLGKVIERRWCSRKRCHLPDGAAGG